MTPPYSKEKSDNRHVNAISNGNESKDQVQKNAEALAKLQTEACKVSSYEMVFQDLYRAWAPILICWFVAFICSLLFVCL